MDILCVEYTLIQAQKSFYFNQIHFIMEYCILPRARWKVFGVAYNWCETWNKQPFGRDPDRSWCHCYIGVKIFCSQPLAPWTSAAAYGQVEKLLAKPTTDVKLGIGAGVNATLHKAFLVAAYGSMDVSGSTFIHCHDSHGLRPKKLYTSVVVTPAPVQVPTQRLLVPSFRSVVH